ncbi:hypothetical protein ACFXK0_03000 [Nocardia sp. NPDC059177]|uniref:hypothetical protein n=1 Tax=Nocardia sp. NPDC059177 TaxID=3346759 RepID=UPI0036AFB774
MGAERSPRASRLRFTATVLLLLLTGVLVVASILARYLRSDLLDTDSYVATVGPLAAEPAIQDAVTDRVTTAIVDRIDIERLTTDLTDALAGDRAEDTPRLRAALNSLPLLLSSQTEDLVRETTESVVRSDRFAELWTAANRGAHTAVAGALTGSGPLTVDDEGTVRVPLDQVVAAVQARLHERGFTVTDALPTVQAEIVVLRDPRIAQAQRWTRLLDRAADLLPILALLTAIAAIVIAPRGLRRRAVVLHGGILVGAMALLAVAIAIGRARYLSEVPLRPDVAELLFDTVADPVRGSLRRIAAYGAVLVIVAILAGPSRPATALRTRITALLGRGGAGSRFAAANSRRLSWAVALVAALILVFWNSPSLTVVVIVAALACLAVLVLQVTARRSVL